ncbi:MAG TPA: ribonuclease R [Caulobacteraceae bacterium]|jgi:ribonuclease R|nr:ribonuclease R [Caulobacteraceae bacterium]
MKARRRPPQRSQPRRAPGLNDAPPVAVADVADRDADGDLWVRLTRAPQNSPLIRLAPARDDGLVGAPGLGDRLLVRIEVLESGEREARLLKRLGQSAHRILGVVRRTRREIRIEPVDRKSKASLVIADRSDLVDGDLVLVEMEPDGSRAHGPKRARLISRLGHETDARAASLIAAHVNGVPMGFSPEALAEAEAAHEPGLTGRADLRAIPLVTIDPADARDHDDAVFAEPDADTRNPGGWVVWVAIADVSAFVRPGSSLDHEAREKGNSVYFPDRVEPMLPEALSAGLCSLSESQTRACLAARMVFDAKGAKRTHRFERGLMRSAASLTYEEAQGAIDGFPSDRAGPLLDPVLRPLWGAYGALAQARAVRSPLEINSVERRIELDGEGHVASIRARASLEAHKLIEEFMIQANVCAAETLERRRSLMIWRVHDAPASDKLQALKDFLATLDIPWSSGEAARTSRFNRLLAQTRGGPNAEIVNEVVLRTQMQAHYATDNIGHFGLNLDRYTHFTSPIRRYADLIVHRALIAALNLGPDGLSASDIAQLTQTAEHVSQTERRAMAAEREAVERYVAAYLADRVGATFAASITGVTRFGLFLRLEETGADGLAPISSLGDEYFHHDEAGHSLMGERTGVRWRLGAKVEARLKEANPVTGGLLFEVLSDPEPADSNWRSVSRVKPGERFRGRRR